MSLTVEKAIKDWASYRSGERVKTARPTGYEVMGTGDEPGSPQLLGYEVVELALAKLRKEPGGKLGQTDGWVLHLEQGGTFSGYKEILERKRLELHIKIREVMALDDYKLRVQAKEFER